MFTGSLTEKGGASRPVNSGIYTVSVLQMQPDYAKIICALKPLKLYSVTKYGVVKIFCSKVQKCPQNNIWQN